MDNKNMTKELKEQYNIALILLKDEKDLTLEEQQIIENFIYKLEENNKDYYCFNEFEEEIKNYTRKIINEKVQNKYKYKCN